MCEEEKPPCKHITTLHTYKTEYNADSVEWCPHEPHKNVFVCANYQLKDSEISSDKRERIGCILLFSVTEKDLKLHQTVYTAAVLDQKWCHNKIDNCSILGVVNAEKTLEIYKLNSEAVKLEFVTKIQIEDDHDETLLLSLDWSTGKYQSDQPMIICSDSNGNVHKFTLSNDKLEIENSWHGHDFEAWIVGFDYWNPNIFFSGGDDCVFLKYDSRVGLNPVSRNRSHEAGVTSMHSNTNQEHILVTGSYDMFVRLWDSRYLKNCRDSVKMPGTIWRLKWDPHYYSKLIAACMLGGIHIVNVDNFEIVDSYYQHESICYGVDWSFLPIESDCSALFATCSFYDNLLCVSKIEHFE